MFIFFFLTLLYRGSRASSHVVPWCSVVPCCALRGEATAPQDRHALPPLACSSSVGCAGIYPSTHTMRGVGMTLSAAGNLA